MKLLGRGPDPAGAVFHQTLLLNNFVLQRSANVSNLETAHALHEQANRLCFIANSVNFPVLHEVTLHAV